VGSDPSDRPPAPVQTPWQRRGAMPHPAGVHARRRGGAAPSTAGRSSPRPGDPRVDRCPKSGHWLTEKRCRRCGTPTPCRRCQRGLAAAPCGRSPPPFPHAAGGGHGGLVAPAWRARGGGAKATNAAPRWPLPALRARTPPRLRSWRLARLAPSRRGRHAQRRWALAWFRCRDANGGEARPPGCRRRWPPPPSDRAARGTIARQHERVMSLALRMRSRAARPTQERHSMYSEKNKEAYVWAGPTKHMQICAKGQDGGPQPSPRPANPLPMDAHTQNRHTHTRARRLPPTSSRCSHRPSAPRRPPPRHRPGTLAAAPPRPTPPPSPPPQTVGAG